jgi:hypothetical protein
MNWRVAVSQRRVLDLPMRRVVHRGKKALGSALRSCQSEQSMTFPNLGDQPSSPLPRFLHGVKPYLYLERLNAEVLRDLGL